MAPGPGSKQVEEALKEIFKDESKLERFFEQKGGVAQDWLDNMQLLVDYPGISSSLRSSILRTMLRLSKRSGLHPRCLSINNVQKLGNFPIAAGGFGEVWKGVIGDLRELVCLKVMKVYLNSDLERLSKEYLREAILWRQMKHPNLLPCLGIYELEHTQQLCLVSPWIENGNLVQYLGVTQQEDVDHHTLARDIATGLAYLHSMRIVHGDLKGLNVLITGLSRAVIADFGLSRIADTLGLRMTTSTTRPAGTVRWMAPELLTGGSGTSKASDVYAYACVCYEILTGGCRPFPEMPNEMAVAFHVAQGKRPSKPENTPRLGDEIWALMELCWNADPPSRPTANQVLDQVLNIKAETSFSPAPEWEETVFTQVWANISTPVDETGVDPKGIDLVMQQTGCSRAKAVGALKESGGDLINAIIATSGG